jgi:hypothetical protein
MINDGDGSLIGSLVIFENEDRSDVVEYYVCE